MQRHDDSVVEDVRPTFSHQISSVQQISLVACACRQFPVSNALDELLSWEDGKEPKPMSWRLPVLSSLISGLLVGCFGGSDRSEHRRGAQQRKLHACFKGYQQCINKSSAAFDHQPFVSLYLSATRPNSSYPLPRTL